MRTVRGHKAKSLAEVHLDRKHNIIADLINHRLILFQNSQLQLNEVLFDADSPILVRERGRGTMLESALLIQRRRFNESNHSLFWRQQRLISADFLSGMSHMHCKRCLVSSSCHCCSTGLAPRNNQSKRRSLIKRTNQICRAHRHLTDQWT